MHYRKELDFTRKVLKNMQLASHIISNNQIPLNIDLGLRLYLGIEPDNQLILKELMTISESNTITVLTDEFMCNYIIAPLPDTAASQLLVCGPYITEEMTRQKLLENAEKQNISPHLFAQFSRYYGNVTRIPDSSILFALITALGEAIWGIDNFTLKKHSRQTNEKDYIINTDSLNELKEESILTVNLIESRYEAERKMMEAVSKGQAHKIAHMLGHASEFVFEARTEDELRNAKNYMIIMNTLLRKAVQDGGVPPYFIDRISSEFAKKIEAASDEKDIGSLSAEMIERYNNLVKEHTLRNFSPSVQKAMAIVDCDLTADLSLKAVSEELGINESYFSSLFRKETTKTFTHFVNEKRIEHAKKLLTSTSLQIQTVAQHCGILDVNYFTKLFRKYTGTTPGKYRNKQ